RLPSSPPLVPYTTLFRSEVRAVAVVRDREIELRRCSVTTAGRRPRRTRASCAEGARVVVVGEEAVGERASRAEHRLCLGHVVARSEEHTSELQSRENLVC